MRSDVALNCSTKCTTIKKARYQLPINLGTISNQSADNGLKGYRTHNHTLASTVRTGAESVIKEIRSFLPLEERLTISLKCSSEVIPVTSLGAQDAAPPTPIPQSCTDEETESQREKKAC